MKNKFIVCTLVLDRLIDCLLCYYLIFPPLTFAPPPPPPPSSVAIFSLAKCGDVEKTFVEETRRDTENGGTGTEYIS